jgi:hypothetical protein
MKLTEQYLRRLIKQTLNESYLKGTYDDVQAKGKKEADEENELEGQNQEMHLKTQGNQARVKYKNVYNGLDQVHRMLQSGNPQVEEMNEIVELLLRGIESGVLPIK